MAKFGDIARYAVSPVAGAAKGGFFDFLTGAGARRDLDAANRDSQGMLDRGYTEARDTGERYYGEGRADLAPYAQQGPAANRLIGNALGMNGQPAQQNYYSNFQHDPGFQSEVDAGIQGLDRSATARGGLYSGAAMKAVQGFGQAKVGESYRNRLQALTGQQQLGQQAAGGQAQLAGQFGGDQMNLRYGYGQQSAGNRINIGNATAGSRNMLMQNLLGIGSIAAKAYGIPGK